VGVGEFLGVDITDFPVRGYETGVLRGDSAALASLEYRFPLWQIERGPATYPIFFNRLLGDVFYDTASAWNHNGGGRAFRDGNTISSAGAEVGLDLVLGFFAPLRYRVGAAYRFDEPDKGSVGFYVTLGSSF
jgi:outer membrane protein assembly factor BamA